MIKKIIFSILITLLTFSVSAEEKTYKMVFVPASEKGDESDYKTLISITEKLTGFNIETIKVTDYNAAVEAMRAGRAHIAWYGGKTYVKAAEIAQAEAFAAGVRPGEKLHETMISQDDAPYTYSYPDYFKILPSIHDLYLDPVRIKDGVKVPPGFTYSSDTNSEWLTPSKLTEWISSLDLS